MISDIETTDIKASYTVSRVLWTLLDTVFASDDEEDALSFFDKELLDDILRFGTIAEVARRKGESYNSVRTKVVQTLDRLEKKIRDSLSLRDRFCLNLQIKEKKNRTY